MANKFSYFNSKVVWKVFVLLFVFVILSENAFTQVFNLQERQYRVVDGKWHTFFEGHKGDQIVPDRLIVRLKDRQDIRQFNLIAEGFEDIKVVSRELTGGYFVLKVGSSQDPFTVSSALAAHSSFDYVEFDAIGEFHSTPSDPNYSNQWNLTKISMPIAWDFNTGSNSVILAIIDTGCDYDHEDLDGNIWVNSAEDRNGNGRPDFSWYTSGGDLDGDDDDGNGFVDDLTGWDFYSYPGDNDPSPGYDIYLVYPHGTAVTGIAAAQTHNYENDNYIGVAGIAGGWGSTQGVKIMNLRYHYWLSGPYYSSTAEAITYAAENGAKVINISSGWTTNWPVLEDAVEDAVDNYDCVIVASAGNNGGDDSSNKSIGYPAKYPDVIAVGATVQDDSRWTTSGSNGSAIGPELDVMAPGGASIIWTTDITGSDGYSSGNYTSGFSGTSASAPHVAGLASLLRSENPSWDYADVKDQITRTAKDLGTTGRDDYYGYGRIDAEKALQNIYVPEQYSTIASALTAAESGKRVVVAAGNHTVSTDLTVSFGITLEIEPGATIEFGNNNNLRVYGILRALGTPTNKITFDKSGSSKWAGIKFEDSSEDGCTLYHCIIKNATIGVYCNRSYPSIVDCSITNNIQGIFYVSIL